MLDGHQRILVSVKLIAYDINATKGLVSVRSSKVGSLSKFQMSFGLHLFKSLFPTLRGNKGHIQKNIFNMYQSLEIPK